MPKWKTAPIVMSGCFVLFARSVWGDVIYVDPESQTNGPGTTWSNAFDNLDDAFDAASPNDEIWIADGIYKPTQTDPTVPSSVAFNLPVSVRLYGGFQGLSRSGGPETSRAQRNPDLYLSILDGDVDNDNELDEDNAQNVVVAVGETVTDGTRLNGFTIRNAYGRAFSIGTGAYPVIARCIISDGGGILIDNEVPIDTAPDGSAKILDCTFVNCRSLYHGGAIFANSNSKCEIVNCVAFENTAVGTGAFFFGAGAASSVVNCTIVSNSTETQSPTGSALRYVGGGTHLIANCIIWNNENGDGINEWAQIADPDGVNVEVSNSDIAELDYFAGNDNFDTEPSFADEMNQDYRMSYFSPLLNNGDPSHMPADTYDIDDDNNTAEPLPDRSMNDRQVNSEDCIDIGAFEEQTAGTCPGDVTDAYEGGPDGEVDDYDLDYVTKAWGTPGGVADLAPDPCGNGIVNVSDLLFVINHWGSCSSSMMGPSEPMSAEQAIAILLNRLRGTSGMGRSDRRDDCVHPRIRIVIGNLPPAASNFISQSSSS